MGRLCVVVHTAPPAQDQLIKRMFGAPLLISRYWSQFCTIKSSVLFNPLIIYWVVHWLVYWRSATLCNVGCSVLYQPVRGLGHVAKDYIHINSTVKTGRITFSGPKFTILAATILVGLYLQWCCPRVPSRLWCPAAGVRTHFWPAARAEGVENSWSVPAPGNFPGSAAGKQGGRFPCTCRSYADRRENTLALEIA